MTTRDACLFCGDCLLRLMCFDVQEAMGATQRKSLTGLPQSNLSLLSKQRAYLCLTSK